jgi:hypothetical protein
MDSINVSLIVEWDSALEPAAVAAFLNQLRANLQQLEATEGDVSQIHYYVERRPRVDQVTFRKPRIPPEVR